MNYQINIEYVDIIIDGVFKYWIKDDMQLFSTNKPPKPDTYFNCVSYCTNKLFGGLIAYLNSGLSPVSQDQFLTHHGIKKNNINHVSYN